jgi:RNA polymerase sigma-70 factor, ECF subfamily
MSATTHPPQTAPADDPVTAALSAAETVENLRRQARVLLNKAVRPRPDVEDVVQNTVARALRLRDRYDPAKGTVGGWLHGILVWVVKEDVRKTHGLPAQPPDDSGWWDRVPTRYSPEVDLADVRFLIERYVGKLSAASQAVVRMRHFDEREYPAIAAALNVTQVSARTLYSRAVIELKQLAAKEGRS